MEKKMICFKIKKQTFIFFYSLYFIYELTKIFFMKIQFTFIEKNEIKRVLIYFGKVSIFI